MDTGDVRAARCWSADRSLLSDRRIEIGFYLEVKCFRGKPEYAYASVGSQDGIDSSEAV